MLYILSSPKGFHHSTLYSTSASSILFHLHTKTKPSVALLQAKLYIMKNLSRLLSLSVLGAIMVSLQKQGCLMPDQD